MKWYQSFLFQYCSRLDKESVMGTLLIEFPPPFDIGLGDSGKLRV